MTVQKLDFKVLAGVALVFLFIGRSRASQKIPDPEAVQGQHVQEYKALYEDTDDKDGLESIRFLHEQLDDDKDGSIEPSETGDFIRVDLHPGSKSQQQDRQTSFHLKDKEITVKDLWQTWRYSEVHNWTVDQTIEWLTKNCELSQYSEHFQTHKVSGAKLPLIAVGGSFMSKVLGIKNPIHRSKITLKAMDVVLFGPPKEPSSFFKDVVFSAILIVATIGFVYAYQQDKKAKENLKRLMGDMEALADAEKELRELQMLDRQNQKSHHDDGEAFDPEEVIKLKQEVNELRDKLELAEVELEDSFWEAPPPLLHWLQLTYELETAAYNDKRKKAEAKLELAKDLCEKLKKNRGSFVGAFVSTHGRSVDDVDKNILNAKLALMEVTKDLQERNTRWRQVEMLCGAQIMNNPGVKKLRELVRRVGEGHRPQDNHRTSRGEMFFDDNNDAHSVAASSLASSHIREGRQVQPAGSSASSISGISSRGRRSRPREVNRESSTSEDEQVRSPPTPAARKATTITATATATSNPEPTSPEVKPLPAVPTRGVVSNNSVPSSPRPQAQLQPQQSKPVVLTAKPPLPPPVNKTASPTSATSAKPATSLSPSASQPSLRSTSTAGDESYSDTASLASTELDENGKQKKKRSFFNFRRKKERTP